jgi:large subunit ribosomal protein L35
VAGRASAPIGHALSPQSQDTEMPKLKTKSGAKKRFGRTASGKITMNVAHKRHRLISKPKQMKRKARGKVTLQPGDAKLVLTYMPYLRG